MRNYKKESQWRDSKYIRFEASVDRQTYEPTVKKIDKEHGRAKWLRRALGLFQKRPELWKEDNDGTEQTETRNDRI